MGQSRMERRRTLALALLSGALAIGWGIRERQFAQAQARRLPNTTLNLSEVRIQDATYEGRTTGKAAVYLDGRTALLGNLQVGRFTLNPGSEPHPPHRHPEEELLIVTRGAGQIVCDGKTYAVRPGAVMFADPQVEHGIRNTGEAPLEFYWIKYLASSGR